MLGPFLVVRYVLEKVAYYVPANKVACQFEMTALRHQV